MRRKPTVTIPWACAVALLTCAMGIARHAAALPPRLQVSIQPIKKRLRATDKLRVNSLVRWQGPRAKFNYSWSTLRGTLPADTVTDRKQLVLDAKDLTPGQEYLLELDVGATYTLPPEKEKRQSDDADEDVVAVQATVAFSVNAPPSDGNCEAEVKWTENGFADIRATAAGWHDSDGDALQYRYYVIKNGARRLVQNWSQKTTNKSKLRAKTGDSLKVLCEVRDSLGDGAHAESNAHKRPALK